MAHAGYDRGYVDDFRFEAWSSVNELGLIMESGLKKYLL